MDREEGEAQGHRRGGGAEGAARRDRGAGEEIVGGNRGAASSREIPPAARQVRARGRVRARPCRRGADALPDAAHLRRRRRALLPQQARHGRLRAHRGAARRADLRGAAARHAPRRPHHGRPVRSGHAGVAVPHPARARIAHRRGLHRLPCLAAVAARRGSPARGRDHLAAAVQARLAHLRDGPPDGAHGCGSPRHLVPAAAAPHSRRGRGAARMTEGLLGLAAFLLLAFMRVPMAFAMGIVGFFGFAWKVNFGAAASMIAQTTYETGLAYTLSVIALFILMGNFVVRARMSEELYHAAYTFLGHRRGGLAMSTLVACAGFRGIYAGVFTATEGAGIGAGGALVFALARRALSWRTFVEVLIESVRTTSMLFMILIGALIFANFVNYTTMPSDLKGFVTQFVVHPILVVVAICAVYVVLGTAMEELSMILLTVPLFFPVVTP